VPKVPQQRLLRCVGKLSKSLNNTSQGREQAERETAKKKRAFASLDEEEDGGPPAPKQARPPAAVAQPSAANGARAPAAVAKHSGPPRTMIMLKFNSVRHPFPVQCRRHAMQSFTPACNHTYKLCRGECMAEVSLECSLLQKPLSQRQGGVPPQGHIFWHALAPGRLDSPIQVPHAQDRPETLIFTCRTWRRRRRRRCTCA
jgi:hypothetical protein